MSKESTITVSCAGGLDRAHNTIELFETPGAATRLINFEGSITGGYRRIDGYAKWGTATPAGTTSPNLGVFRYADGVVSCQDTGVYFSTDGITWIQVNKQGASAGLDVTALGAAAAEARPSQGRNQFSIYEGQEEYGILVITDGVNEIANFKITDTGGRKYYYEEVLTAVGAPETSQYNVIYKERSVVANSSMVYYSGRFTMNDFTLASAGYLDVGDKITGLRVHRENLYVFCKNSIHVINNIDEGITRKPVTRNVGCLDGFSIQEIGGDIIFLAQDGFRTIAGTDRIDDVELSTISRNIFPILQIMIEDIDQYDISSTVIRSKSQYRMFYTKPSQVESDQKGVIGVVKAAQNGLIWEWSETSGIEAAVVSSEIDKDVLEKVYHGDYDGWVYDHTSGTSFDGSNIRAVYKSPDIHYGDTGIRKTLYTVKLSASSEVTSNITMRVRYEFASPTIHQPANYVLDPIYPSAQFGIAVFGSSIFGGTVDPLIKINVEGSGSSNYFQFESNDTTSSYTIRGFYVDFTPSGRVD